MGNFLRPGAVMFLQIACVVLCLSGFAKVWSAIGASIIPTQTEPIGGVRIDRLLLIAAVLEFSVVALCIFRSVIVGLLAVAWLSLVILAYRIALWWVGWEKPCGCLGNLTDALHMSPQLADNIMKGVLAFMLLGSVSLLILHWRKAGSVNAGEASSTPAAAN
jgi:hypothetical protein